MTHTWTLPGVGIYETDDPYTLQVTSTSTSAAALNTVFLQTHITYADNLDGPSSWDYTVSFYIELIDPCVNTELVMPDNYLKDITYDLGEAPQIVTFDDVTDTVTNGITNGNCGELTYSWTTNNTKAGTDYLSRVQLIDS